MSHYPDLAYLRELATVLHMAQSAPGGPDTFTRECLVRRAAVLDRSADIPDCPGSVAEFVVDAAQYAQALLDHDLQHGGTLGPVPADAPCWRADPRGYARQEHRAWILAQEV